jgi:probable rRNA maturation factor
MIEFDNRQEKMDFNDNIKSIIEKTIEYALNYEGFNKPYEISVVITDNEGIREINREFRNIDKETDVLSFPMLEFEDDYVEKGEIEVEVEDLNPESGEVVLGDIVISLEKAKSQAEEYGHSYEREIAFLTVHSVLHLLGYDHEQEDDRVIMRSKEESILTKLGFLR